MTQLGTTDPIVEHLRHRQMPVTLENWLTFAFSGEPPENWQIETEVPLELQDELEEYLNRSSSPASKQDQKPRRAPTARGSTQNTWRADLFRRKSCKRRRGIWS